MPTAVVDDVTHFSVISYEFDIETVGRGWPIIKLFGRGEEVLKWDYYAHPDALEPEGHNYLRYFVSAARDHAKGWESYGVECVELDGYDLFDWHVSDEEVFLKGFTKLRKRLDPEIPDEFLLKAIIEHPDYNPTRMYLYCMEFGYD
jgi:hypothetical protein